MTSFPAKNPKIAGAASPFGSGDLKDPSFPPVAKGLPCRDLVDATQSPNSATLFPLISIVRMLRGSFQEKANLVAS